MSIKNKVIGIFFLFSAILVLVMTVILLTEKNNLHQLLATLANSTRKLENVF